MKVTASPGQLAAAKIPADETGIEIKKTLCTVCTTQCGIDAYVKDGRLIKVEGSIENPVNRGKLCAKGAANRQWIYSPERVQTPLLRAGERGSGEFRPISWDEALDRIAAKLLAIKKETGPEAAVFFVGYPKVMRPFLKRMAHLYGSPNYCTESSVCSLAPNLAGMLNYGYETGPMSGAQIQSTRCILNWSTNPFYSSAPRAIQILEALERGAKLIDVGPLRTMLSERADIHLRIRPGTSGALALGMANVIVAEGLYDREFVENWTLGFEEFQTYLQGFSPENAGRITGVPAEKIFAAARLYATTGPAAIVTSANTTVHHTNGVQNHRALIALIGLTGNFDRPGGNHIVPKVHYLNRGHAFEQSRPWSEMAPRLGQDLYPVWCRLAPEAQAVVLPHQILSAKPYPIRAVIGFGLNHRMWPGSDFMREALRKVEFSVNTELFLTETAKLADIVLPACSSFERSELFLTPSGYAIWTEPVIAPVGQSRSDIDIITDLAGRLGPNDELLSRGHEACIEWIYTPSGIRIDELKRHPGGLLLAGFPKTPFEKYRGTGFPTPSGKMEFTSLILKEAGIDPLPVYREPLQSPLSTPELTPRFPLILTTGARLPMFIHSRTYRVPWLRRLRPDPLVDLNPADTRTRGIEAGQWVKLRTPRGEIRVRANPTEYVPPGVANVIYGFPGADVNEIIDPDYRDPISGFPGFKSLLCEVAKA